LDCWRKREASVSEGVSHASSYAAVRQRLGLVKSTGKCVHSENMIAAVRGGSNTQQLLTAPHCAMQSSTLVIKPAESQAPDSASNRRRCFSILQESAGYFAVRVIGE